MKRTVTALGCILRTVLALALAISVAAVAGVAVLAWRLAQGPLEMDWAARRIEAVRNSRDGPTRLAIGYAAIAWEGFDGGNARGLELRLRDVRITGPNGAPVAALGQLDLTVAMSRLLLGQVVPRRLVIDRLDLHILRDLSGGLAADLAGLELGSDDQAPPGPNLRATILELTQPPAPANARVRPGLQHLEQLRVISIANTSVTIQEPGSGPHWKLDLPRLDLRRHQAGGVTGRLDATLSRGPMTASLTATADLDTNGGTRLDLALLPAAGLAMQQAAPDLSPDLAAPNGSNLDAAIRAEGTLLLDTDLMPTSARLRVDAATGSLRVAGTPIGFDSLAIELVGAWDTPAWRLPQRLDVTRAKAVMHASGGAWPATIQAAARATIGPTGAEGSVEASLDHISVPDLVAVWPAPVAIHVRPWFADNVTAGTARDAAVKAAFKLRPDLTDFALTAIDASLRAEDLTIRWMGNVPPVEGAQAMLTMRNPDQMDIAVASARQGPIQLRDGQLRINGLAKKDQDMTISATMSGTAADAVAFLRLPALNLLARSPLSVNGPAGTFTGRLDVAFPLEDDLPFEKVKIATSVRTTDLRLGGFIAGRDLERGRIQIDANVDSLKATGQASVAGIPAELTANMDFCNGPPSQVTLRATATARASGRQLAVAGIKFEPVIHGGTAQFDVRYQQRRDNRGEVEVKADLRDTRMELAGWQKPVGQSGQGSARILLRNDRMQGIDTIRVQAPGLLAEGRAEMVGPDPLNLILDRLELGATRAQGRLLFPERPNDPIRATLSGAVLDLAPQLNAPPAKPGEPPGTPFTADVRFDRVLLAADQAGPPGLPGLVATAQHDGRRLTDLQATTGGPERLELTIRPEAAGRRLRLMAADAGILLRAANIADTVTGGRLRVEATYDDRRTPAPLAGTATMESFQVTNARVLGKLLQAATIYGVVEAMQGNGLSFDSVTMPFTWAGAMLDVTEARIVSASLGLTAHGRVDTARHSVDLKGTVVPMYAVNAALGRIPVLGRIFSAETGGGLVAVEYTIRGPTADPAILVNPLSALTPGFLRNLFRIFD